jgi:uncharacterized protein RhaS with RHS repeats
MTEDPIGLAGGDVGLYRYVQNDPVNFVDPYGLLTTGHGISVTFSFLGVGIDYNYLSVTDDSGNSGSTHTWSIGGSSELIGLDIMGSSQMTTANTIFDLAGGSGTVGGGGGQYVGGNWENIYSGSYTGRNVNAGGTLGLSPIDLHGYYSYTFIAIDCK